MKQVFKCLQIEPVGEIPEPGRLEGGDFMIVRSNLALLGVGLRSNVEAAQ